MTPASQLQVSYLLRTRLLRFNCIIVYRDELGTVRVAALSHYQEQTRSVTRIKKRNANRQNDVGKSYRSVTTRRNDDEPELPDRRRFFSRSSIKESTFVKAAISKINPRGNAQSRGIRGKSKMESSCKLVPTLRPPERRYAIARV